jgi:hypothetical protein
MMDENLIPVENADGWFRDAKTNAIVYGNQLEYDKYIEAYNARQRNKKKFQDLQSDVSVLKSEMSDIKALLVKLIEDKKNDN